MEPQLINTSETPSPRQTMTYLKDLFRARGLQPKHKMGQCFLVDLNLMDVILREAELSKSDLALEVGCGTGGLTLKMAEQAGAVLGIELDPGFFTLVEDFARHFRHVKIIRGDVLKNKNKLNPSLVEMLHEAAKSPHIHRVKLVANLPYVVATPVVINLLLLDSIDFERMVIMVQWEMAARLCAEPRTKDYNANSVFVQALTDVEIIRRLGPRAFFPPPKVDSAIVRIRPNKERRHAIIDKLGSVQRLHRFLHGLYLHRRKNLRGALLPLYRDQFDKATLDEHLSKAGFDGVRRAEELTVGEHIELCGCLPTLV